MSNRDTTRECRSSESGTALLGALLMAITILGLTAAALTSGIATNNQVRYLTAGHKANAAAEAGMTHLVAALSGPQRAEVLAAGQLQADLVGTEGSKRTIRYDVRITSGAADGIDNDLDGLVDEADEGDYFEVSSTGRADNIARTLRVTLGPRYASLNFPHAIFYENPNAELRLKDQTDVLFSGRDVDLDGNETGLLVPGIGVLGDPSAILAQIPSVYDSRINGLGGDRSVHEVSGVPYLADLIAETVTYPELRFRDDSHRDGVTWGTIADPKRVHVLDDFRVCGTHLKGAGVLVIDDRLRLYDGAIMEWVGLIVVRGRLKNDRATLRVTGGLMLAGADFDRLESDEAITHIQYSKEALRTVTRVRVVGHTALNWRLAANPKE